MKSELLKIISAFCGAWEELFDIPCPFRNIAAESNEFTPAAFPVTGWIAGAAAAFAGILTGALFNLSAGAVIFAVAAWCVLTFKDSCRGDRRLCEYGKKLQLSDVLIAIPWLVRFVLLLTIGFFGCKWYFTLVVAGGFAMQAFLATSDECRAKLLSDDLFARRALLTVSIVIAVLTFAVCRLETALAVIVFAALYLLFVRRIGEVDGQEAVERVTFCGYVAEWALLLTGILF